MNVFNGVNIKKSMFAIGASLVLLLAAGTALAAAKAPVTGTSTSQSAGQPISGSYQIAPCPMMQGTAGYNMMYRGYPCQPVNYQSWRQMAYGSYASRQAAWYGLMFIITVALVWVVLMLLIALLWKHVKKHGRS